MSVGTWEIQDEISRTIQLFQSELLGFSDEGKDHEPCDKVKPSIEADCHLS